MLWRDLYPPQRGKYYYAFCSYVTVLSLAGYLAWKHEELLFFFLFGWMALHYTWQNWSFARSCKLTLHESVATMPESKLSLFIHDDGITQSDSGVEVWVPWAVLHSYAVHENRVIIPFLEGRAFIIPLAHLGEVQRLQLFDVLNGRNLREVDPARASLPSNSGS